MVEEKNKVQKKKNQYNACAIIGFILSIIGFFGIGLAALIGLVFGIVALVQIKHTHEKGKGIAIAAIVIGFIWGILISIIKALIEAGY